MHFFSRVTTGSELVAVPNFRSCFAPTRLLPPAPSPARTGTISAGEKRASMNAPRLRGPRLLSASRIRRAGIRRSL